MTWLSEALSTERHYCDRCGAIAIEYPSTGDMHCWTFDSIERYVEEPVGVRP